MCNWSYWVSTLLLIWNSLGGNLYVHVCCSCSTFSASIHVRRSWSTFSSYILILYSHSTISSYLPILPSHLTFSSYVLLPAVAVALRESPKIRPKRRDCLRDPHYLGDYRNCFTWRPLQASFYIILFNPSRTLSPHHCRRRSTLLRRPNTFILLPVLRQRRATYININTASR